MVIGKLLLFVPLQIVVQNNKGGTICTTYCGGTIKHGGTDNNTIMNKDKHIPSGYKPSPLGPIPEDWEVKRLGEICTHFKSGNTITSKEINEDGLYPVYGGNGLRGYSNTFTHEGDFILIGRQGALCGNINYVEGRNHISEHAIAVQTDENMQWLKYKLENWNLNRFSESSAQPGLSVEKLVRYKLAIPTRLEQNKIADILQLWDTAIAKQTALIEKLNLRKRGLMQQLLTGKKRLKGFSGEWKEVRLGEVFEERNETNCDNLPLLSITGDKGVIYQSESDKRDISNEDKSKYKRICPNDIGYNTMRMWQGRSALSELEGIVSPAYTIVTPKESIDVRFMAMLVQQPQIVYSFWTHSQGLVSDTLNCKYPDFSQVKVTIPHKDEQTANAEFFIGLNKEIELANKKLAKLQEEKKGLMQVLLTGKKRVK